MLVSLLLLSACGAPPCRLRPWNPLPPRQNRTSGRAGTYAPAGGLSRCSASTPGPCGRGLPTAPSFLSALELLEGRMGYEGFTDEQKSACRAELSTRTADTPWCCSIRFPPARAWRRAAISASGWRQTAASLHLLEQQIDLSQRDGMHVDGVYIENIDGDFFCSWSAGCSASREVFYALDDPAAPACQAELRATAIDYIDGIYVPREDCEFFYINGEAVDRQAYYSLRDTLIIGNPGSSPLLGFPGRRLSSPGKDLCGLRPSLRRAAGGRADSFRGRPHPSRCRQPGKRRDRRRERAIQLLHRTAQPAFRHPDPGG